MAKPDSENASWERRVTDALVVLAWILAFLVVWLPEWPPGRDQPAHVIATSVWAFPAVFAEWLTPNIALSGAVVDPLAGLVAKFLGVSNGMKVALSVSVIANALGLARLAKVGGSDPRLASVVGLGIGCGWLYGMGFSSFVAAIGFGLLAGSYALEERPKLPLVAGLYLFAVWWHLIAGGMIFAGMGLVRLLRDRSIPPISWILAWLPGLSLGIYIGLLYIFGQSGAGAPIVTTWGTPAEWLRDLFLCSLTSFHLGTGWISGIAVTGMTAVGAVAAWRRPVVTVGDALLRGTVVWLVLLVVVPLDGLGWSFARPRMMPMAVLVPLAFLAPRAGRLSIAIATTILIALVGALIGGVERGHHIAAVVDDFDSGEAAGSTFLVSYLDLEYPGDGPYVYTNLALANYALLNGGVARHLFAHNAAAHSMLFVEEYEMPEANPVFIHVMPACVADEACSGGPVVRGDRLALAGLAWDSIAVVGLGDEEREQLVRRGYTVGAPGLLHSRPSSVRIDVTVPDDLAAFPIVARYGYETSGVVGGAAAHAVDGRARIELPNLIAGPTVLELFIDRDGDNAPSAADAAILDSPRIRLDVPPGETLVVQN